MRILAGSVEEMIRKSVLEYNDEFPHKKLITYITNMENPRRLTMQSRDFVIKASISQLFLNLSNQRLPHLEVRISRDEKEFNFEYFSIRKVWWSTEKNDFCDVEEIRSSLNSLLEIRTGMAS